MKLLVSYAARRTKELDTKYELAIKATDTAVLGLVDWETGETRSLLEYQSPVENRHPDLRMAFKAGCFTERQLLLPTSTEILVLDRTDLHIDKVVSLPVFNDLHHVMVMDNEWIVCNTGLDSLVWLDKNGSYVKEMPILESSIVQRYPRNTDFRQVKSTKPQFVHPNYVFRGLDGELFVTCFFQKRAINIADPDDFFDIQLGNPHDGLVFNDRVVFTTTNGHLLIFDGKTRKIIKKHDLPKLWGVRGSIGWCRGLCISNNRLFVGFSKIRETKSKEFARWVRHGLKKSVPSRIVEVNIETGAAIGQVVLPDEDAPVFDLIALEDNQIGLY